MSELDTQRGYPSLEYIGRVFELMAKHGVEHFQSSDFIVQRPPQAVYEDEPEEEAVVEPEPVPTPSENERKQLDLPFKGSAADQYHQNPYNNPRTFGRDTLPYFPEQGSLTTEREPEQE